MSWQAAAWVLYTPTGYRFQPGSAVDHSPHVHDNAAAAIDPVCGMTVDPQKTPHKHIHQHRDYFFCSAGCRTKFATNPAKYLAPKPAPDAPSGAIYTCPMHPEIRQIGPGSCPICGMALEPEAGGADDDGELRDM
ncbi:MAG TPA: heavy metal-binding domain-containing protein, partial [Xanthobacteraceae bacterium]|nr:heavy metal-binding domain-containing protein [Xanthobacteraceae bacterium]